MSKEKSGGGNKSAPVKPSNGGGKTANRNNTNPINQDGKFNQTTTGSTGPKGPTNKK